MKITSARNFLAGMADGHGNRLVVFLLVKAEMGCGAKFAFIEKFEEFRIAFIHAKDFVRRSGFGFGKADRSEFLAKHGHASLQRHAVRATAVAAEALYEQVCDFSGDAVLEFFRFLVGS